MPVPAIVATGLAAARVVAGIIGKGSKNVNPVYRNQFTSEQGLGTLKKIADKADAKKAATKANELPAPPKVPGLTKQPTIVTGSSVKVNYRSR